MKQTISKLRKLCLILLYIVFLMAGDLTAQKKNDILLYSIARRQADWEVGIGGGVSRFMGSLNFYPPDFLSVYRYDGNEYATSFGCLFHRHFSTIFSYGLLLNYNELEGEVTYRGDIETTAKYSYYLQSGIMLTPGVSKGDYSTRVYTVMPTINVEAIELFNYLFSFQTMSLSRVTLIFGAGISHTDVNQPAFPPSDHFYDFGDSNCTELTLMGGVRYARILNNKLSVFVGGNYFLVAGAKPDGYFIANDPKLEGIPAADPDGHPFLADTFMNVHLGVILRLNKRRPGYWKAKRF